MFQMLYLAFALAVSMSFPGSAQPQLSLQDCAALHDAYGVTREECQDLIGDLGRSTETPSNLSDEDMQNNIFFKRGGIALDADAKAQIKMLAQILQTPPMRSSCIRLVGHADRTGSAQINERMSHERALAVAAELRRLLRDPYRITDVLGVGDSQTLKNMNPAARENRRVTIFAKTCDR